jgi:hypothetical protein
MESPQVVEAGVGAHGIFGASQMGVGGDGWLEAQLLPPGSIEGWGAVQLVGRGSATPIFAYAEPSLTSDVLVDGSLGVRADYAVLPTLHVGGEVLGGYELRTSTGSNAILLSAGMPVAEAASPDLWVYTDPTVGLIIRVAGDACSHNVPFCGYSEVPLGVVWRATPWLLLVGEGGLSLPIQYGGYAGVAASFRL